MNKKIMYPILSILFILILTINVTAHVPYIERNDYSKINPMYVRKMLEKSKAFYAWLDNDRIIPKNDIDVFKFKIKNRPKNVYIELIVPVVDDYYKDFVPWFALVGPRLPEPDQSLPFRIPKEYGVIVKKNVEPSSERASFYEPFGGKSYYNGPILDEDIETSGTYFIYVWDPYKKSGDYVLVIGKGEFFGPIDIIRSIINTMIIRQNKELHII